MASATAPSNGTEPCPSGPASDHEQSAPACPSPATPVPAAPRLGQLGPDDSGPNHPRRYPGKPPDAVDVSSTALPRAGGRSGLQCLALTTWGKPSRICLLSATQQLVRSWTCGGPNGALKQAYNHPDFQLQVVSEPVASTRGQQRHLCAVRPGE